MQVTDNKTDIVIYESSQAGLTAKVVERKCHDGKGWSKGYSIELWSNDRHTGTLVGFSDREEAIKESYPLIKREAKFLA